MRNEDRARWTKLVADYESADLSQREFAQERGISLSPLRQPSCRLHLFFNGGEQAMAT